MVEKNNVKIHLTTVFILIALVVIIILGFFIYKFYKDKKHVERRVADLESEIVRLENNVDSFKAIGEQEEKKSNFNVISKSEIPSSTENYSDELSNDTKKVLISKTYSNFAWSSKYNVMAIFNDGTVYSWSFTGKLQDLDSYNVNSADGLRKCLLKNGKWETIKISANDLEKIEEYTNSVEGSVETIHQGADQGTTTISAWNSNGKEIKLSVTGDSVGENKANNAQELLKLVSKYF